MPFKSCDQSQMPHHYPSNHPDLPQQSNISPPTSPITLTKAPAPECDLLLKDRFQQPKRTPDVLPHRKTSRHLDGKMAFCFKVGDMVGTHVPPKHEVRQKNSTMMFREKQSYCHIVYTKMIKNVTSRNNRCL